MSISKNIKIALLYTTAKLANGSRFIRKISSPLWLAPTPTPERLIVAPYNLNTPVSITADDIVKGRYYFAGQMVELENQTPFKYQGASDAWKAKLNGFEWLRHLTASKEPQTLQHANTLIKQWISAHAKPSNTIAWDLDITSHRLIAWLFSSVQIVEQSDSNSYKAWMKTIGTHIKFIRHSCSHTPISIARLNARIALAYASICVSDQESYLRNAAKLLDDELNAQILSDGGHITRNPSLIPKILCYLLPLRESYAKLGKVPSQELVSAIDRLMIALKFYRMGDGEIAHFNGATDSKIDIISAILRYDDARGTISESASTSNYQRISKKNAILIADTGSGLKGKLSQTMHAGTLAFEFSSGKTPILVNCGQAENANNTAKQAARHTAAHNALVIEDRSSSQIYLGNNKTINGRLISTPSSVTCLRDNQEKFSTLTMSHDGYLSRFSAIHHRMLGLDETGDRVIGEDKLLDQNGNALNKNDTSKVSIHFHLNPALSAGKSEDGRSILIMGGNGIAWKFSCLDIVPQLEESIFFAAPNRPRKTKQIVLYSEVGNASSIRWIFEKQLQEKA